jgi:predicted esterase
LNPTEHHIPVTRTARYYTLGELNNNTKDIWILLHGHKVLAGNFILTFEELSGKGSFLVAPEGLMRFYMKGDFGNVGASWMTKEDREADIKDYVNYLDRLFFDVVEPGAKINSLKINALGFSQGSATLSRWLSLGKANVDKAVFWAGSLAHDVDFSKAENLKRTEIHQVFGNNDPYYPDVNFPKKQQEIFTQAGITSKIYIFNGGHEVNPELLKDAGFA